jgi:RHS repeat-associated protein
MTASAAPQPLTTGRTPSVYSGASTLVETIQTCWNNNCSATPAYPITQKDVYTTLAGMTTSSRVSTTYDQYGNVTSVATYDFGASTPTDTVVIAYGSWTGSACQAIPNIYDHVCYKTTHSGTSRGPIIANHTSTYDLSAGNIGNLLTSSDWVSGNNWLSKHFTYDPNGALKTVQDVNGTTTTYTNGACNGHFPTNISVAGLSTQQTWDCNGGVRTSVTDPNSDTTTYDFTNGGADPFYRVKAIISPAPFNDTTTFTYTPNSVRSTLSFGTSTVDVATITDLFGRPQLKQKRQSPTSSTYDTVQTTYDYRGRVYQVTRPCSAVWNSGCSLTGATTHGYDVLNRPTSVADGGGGQVTTAYTKNDVTVTLNPKPTGDTHNKVRNYEYDGLGRLKSVCEVTSLSGNTACGQAVGNNGYLTTYNYDLANSRFIVSQGAQTRTIYHDGVGRTTQETNPENGTVQYSYDTYGCGWTTYNGGSSNGDLTKRIDAAGNTVCFVYDALHRMTDAAGWTGTTWRGPCRRFRFDNALVPPSGITTSNTLGRLQEALTDNCGATGFTSEFFSYDNDGRMTDMYQSTPNSGGYYHSTASYYPNGALASLSPGIGGNQVTLPWTFALDGEGRTYSESNPNGLILQSTTYNVDGTISAVTHANGDSDSFQYDPNTGRMTQYQFTVGATPKSLVGKLTWNANGTLQQQQIATDQFNAANVQTCTYTYDDITRLATGNCGTPWSQTYSYDQYGNVLQKSGNGPFQASYSNPNTTNRIATIVGEPNPSYDANGNLLSAESHTFSWDPNWGNSSSIDGKTLTYDALGRMVEMQNGSATTQFMFGPTGKVAIMNGQTEVQSFQPFPGGGVFVHRPGSQTNYWRHADLLGSSRLATTLPGRALFYDGAYASFGENYVETGTTDRSFTGQTQDTTATFGGIYDFMFRKYSPVQGRWISPDPAGVGAADPSNPQSWNRYDYTFNNPVSSADPLGLYLPAPDTIYSSKFDGAWWRGGTECRVDGASTACGSLFIGGRLIGITYPCLANNCSRTSLTTGGELMWLASNRTINEGELDGVYHIHANPTWVDEGPLQLFTSSLFGFQSLTSVKTFFTGIARNFTHELKAGGCFQQFVHEAFDPSDEIAGRDAAIKDVARSGAYTAAIAYSAQRALVVPMRSSIVRGILQAGESLGEVAAIGLTDLEEGGALFNELTSYARGECH